MKFAYGLSAVLLGAGAAIALVQPQLITASTAEEINAIAEKITVRINGPENGSGVIIDSQGNSYTVLTNWHVLDSRGQYRVQTYARQEYPVDYSTVTRIGDLDLALFQFTSNRSYNIAEMGDSDNVEKGMTVYAAGWPEPRPGIPERAYQFKQGYVSELLQTPHYGGYALIHTNSTRRGMSGGPLLDGSGRLIGIHGRTEGLRDETGDIRPHPDGDQLGIPINIFKDKMCRDDLTLCWRLELGFRYRHLHDLLESNKWREADEQTHKIVLRLASRVDYGWLNADAIARLPCKDLSTINKLWQQYSGQRFGFSTQKRIWKVLGGEPGEENPDIFAHFAETVGWRRRRLGQRQWLTYDELTFSLNAPKGHLPRRFLDGPAWEDFFSHMEACGL